MDLAHLPDIYIYIQRSLVEIYRSISRLKMGNKIFAYCFFVANRFRQAENNSLCRRLKNLSVNMSVINVVLEE